MTRERFDSQKKIMRNSGENGIGTQDRLMMALLKDLYPLHRTINSDDMEKSLRMIGDYIGKGFRILPFKPGTAAFSWTIPPRYSVDEAYIDCNGKRFAEFSKSNLSVVSYSIPINKCVSYQELRRHVFTQPDLPDETPWMFKYYERTWGFCMPHRQWLRLDRNAKYRVVIKSRFEKKPFMVGEYVIPGHTNEEILWVSDICHPSQVNDSITGAVVAAHLAKVWTKRYKGRFTLRFLFLPETIGSVAWFSRNLKKISRIRYGMFCEMLGNDNRFLLKLSRQGDTPWDRIAKRAFKRHKNMGETKVITFQQIAPQNDEKVMNGVGIDIPTVSFTRWPYREYHTSADNPNLIQLKNLKEAFGITQEMLQSVNYDLYPISTVRGPIMLSRYKLWVPYDANPKLNQALQRILFMLNGQYSVADIAEEVMLDSKTLRQYLKRFEAHGLIRWNRGPWEKER
ncbi:MAG: DUF4910 domain-containing protein [Candidatus Omnitrophota bacterium]|jgi:aminopeptidase-like protein